MKVHAKNTDRLGHLLNTLKVAGPQIPSLCSHFCSQSTTTLIERLVVFLSYMLVFPFPLSRSAPCPLPTPTRDRVPIPAATRDFGAPLLAPMLLLVTASHPSHPFPSDNTPFPSPSPSINHHRASHCWIRGDDVGKRPSPPSPSVSRASITGATLPVLLTLHRWASFVGEETGIRLDSRRRGCGDGERRKRGMWVLFVHIYLVEFESPNLRDNAGVEPWK